MTHSTTHISPMGAVAAGLAVIAAVLFAIGAPELGLVAVVAFLVVGGAMAFDAMVSREKVPERDLAEARIALDPEEVPRDYVAQEPFGEETAHQAS
jgi:hypothetical protein